MNRSFSTAAIIFSVFSFLQLFVPHHLKASAEGNAPYECSWRRCGHLGGILLNCGKVEYGTTDELIQVIRSAEKGAVQYECGFQGEKNESIKR